MPEIAVALATLAGPWGPLQVAATARGVVAAGWTMDDAWFRDRLGRRLGGRPVGSAAALRTLREALPIIERVLAGEPLDVSLVPLDLADRPLFDQRVLQAVREIPWGTTVSYGEVARRVGAPRAARAVGGAVGRNPVALLVPCHRVIAGDGTLGGYGGGDPTEREAALAQKRALLLREGVTVAVRPR